MGVSCQKRVSWQCLGLLTLRTNRSGALMWRLELETLTFLFGVHWSTYLIGIC